MKRSLATGALSRAVRLLPFLAYAALAAAAWDFAAESPWRAAALPDALGSDKGAETLPAEVVEMRDIVVARGMLSFRLSDELKKDGLLSQRAVEYLYPVRTDDASAFVFAKATEPPRGCLAVGQGAKIVLYECPP